MVSNNTEPALLVEFKRDGLVEREHYGFIVLADKIVRLIISVMIKLSVLSALLR